MTRKSAALFVAIAALVLAACGGRAANVSNDGSSALPGMPDLVMTATLPDGRRMKPINEELPSEGLGTIDDSFWSATLGGFTQQNFSQALGFPPRTKITITNISKNISHTLDEVSKIKGPPANFPQNPTLSKSAAGNGKMGKGYASGILTAGATVTLTLPRRAGIYLIGCAFHYGEGMRTVLVVAKGATPGPEATAPPR